MEKLTGIGASKGVAVGRLYHFDNAAKKVKLRTTEDTDAELKRFYIARKQAIVRLGELYHKACDEIGREESMIFEIHQMLLEDQDYVDSVNNLIRDARYTAEYAVQRAGEQFAQMFAVMDDAYLKERSADMIDISNRIVRLLCGEHTSDLSKIEGQFILAANDLLPSETIQIDQSKVLAFITSSGSRVSHSAILARTMGIPAVVGLGNQISALQNGVIILVDGFNGSVIVGPDEAMLVDYMHKRTEHLENKERLKRLKGTAFKST